MTLPIYLAMTAPEMDSISPLPPLLAYMACHFSPYGTGICNLPTELPAGSMLILNDRIPVCNHDPQEILHQLQHFLEETSVSAVLLDLQREGCEASSLIAKTLAENLSVPVGVSQHYAMELDCPVFVDPPALHVPISQYLTPWKGRDIWLDGALFTICYQVDRAGCKQYPCNQCDDPLPHRDAQLHCHYCIRRETDHVAFTLERTAEDLQAMLAEGQHMGVTTAIGLYQEWYSFP